GGLFALVFAIISAGDAGWTAPQVLESFGLAVVLLAAFVYWESRTPNAMLPLRFFANPSFSLANVAVVLMTFSLFGTIFMLSQYFQSVLGYDPLTVGVIQLPVVIVMTFIATRSAAIAQRFGTKRTVAMGALLTGLALLYLRLIAAVDTPYTSIFLMQILFGLGLGLTTSPATNSVMQSLPIRKSGIGSAMNDMTRQIGGAMGVAILGSILNGAYRASLSQPLQAVKEIPDTVRETILRSIQGANLVALQLPGSASAIVGPSRVSFVLGMQQAVLLAGVVMLVSAVVTFAFLPDKVQRSSDTN
ncbi:MAG TPA: MFS transporter, partial [Aggregatilineales bacterium]|nr:MFS transporter [Aggregatilineales bacterium]